MPEKKIKFVKDSRNPTKAKKTIRDSKSVKDTLPTKNGIYKPVPKAPEKTTSSAKKKPKRQPKKKVQFSSREKAQKAMRKNVKRRQRGKSSRTGFDL